MKLQFALDRLTKEECLVILEKTSSYIDWIEIGTGVIKEYGMSIVKEIKAAYPEHPIIADMKTCDAGKHEAEQAFSAGADITTVMGFSHDGTIKDMLMVAGRHKKRVMVDLLGITEPERIQELRELGADLASLHVGKDMQKEGNFDKAKLFRLMERTSGMETAVAGGITEEALPDFLPYKPDVIIVGSGITKAEDPEEAARRLKGMITS